MPQPQRGFERNRDVSTITKLVVLRWQRATTLGQRKDVENCPEYIRLRSEVENVLANLAQVTMLLLDLFRSDNTEKYAHLDKELELTIGEKERAVGALRQHIREHKCRPE